MNKLVTEFLGTFFLLLAVGLAVPKGGNFVPVAIGLTLMVWVYAGGHISGAHYNPAVSLAAFVRGKLTKLELGQYIVVQLVGATVATFVVKFLMGGAQNVVPMVPSMPQALLAEFIFTFALAYIVLNVATAKGTSGNSFYGLAIGMTVAASIFLNGGISGGVLNPAASLGVGLMNFIQGGALCSYVVVQLLGGLAAGLLFKVLIKE